MTAEAEAGLPPRLSLAGRLVDATIGEKLFGLPVEVAAARGSLSFALEAVGHSPAALLGSLSGRMQLDLRDGVLAGFDLAAAAIASALPDALPAEAAIREALLNGATAFDRLAAEGASATLSGEIDLARATLDVLVLARPAMPEAPDIGLRLTGPAADPRALPETSAWAVWRAARP
jgi:hypothetical protein